MIFGEQVRSRELKFTAFGLVEINRNLTVTVIIYISLLNLFIKPSQF
jgi:hypothetical protein